MNQITKKSAWDKPLSVDDTDFIDSAASLTLLHNCASHEDPQVSSRDYSQEASHYASYASHAASH